MHVREKQYTPSHQRTLYQIERKAFHQEERERKTPDPFYTKDRSSIHVSSRTVPSIYPSIDRSAAMLSKAAIDIQFYIPSLCISLNSGYPSNHQPKEED